MNDNEKSSTSFKVKLAILGSSILAVFILLFSFYNYSISFADLDQAVAADEVQIAELNAILDSKFSLQRRNGLKPIPYSVESPNLDIWSGAAVLINASNGNILYEKNADEVIPPASITKLFVMYIAFDEIAKGNISLDDIIPVPEAGWSQPSDASKMGLGKGHIVTLRELLVGMSVVSGNDAAVTVATHIAKMNKKKEGYDENGPKSFEEMFVERMNRECKNLGLNRTHFEDTSGYSELNETTARELAEFLKIYITKYPQSLENFHSVESFSYPQEWNFPSWAEHTKPRTKKNTNPLLGKLEGCDGIKTGYIDESGYNLSLTCMRDGQRFISVTLKGPGRGTAEGDKTRFHDGQVMMEWAFENYADYNPAAFVPERFPVAVPGSCDGKFAFLIPAWNNAISVRAMPGLSAKDTASKISAIVTTPRYIYGGVAAGEEYGCIEFKLGDIVLEKVPLVADRTMRKSGFAGSLIDSLACELF